MKWLLIRLSYALLGFVALSVLLVLPWKWINPPTSMVMLDRALFGTYAGIEQHWLPWPQIPKHAALAVVVAEDQLFLQHPGFDLDAIQQALRERHRRAQLRGASTISQQVARNMFLWTGRSWFRKGLEAWFTVLIEHIWGKQRILEVYLNIAEWGPGVFGVEAASRYHFGHPAAQLSQRQAALLASSLPSPLRYTPGKPDAYLERRVQWNLNQQRKLGGIQWLAPLD